MATSTITSTVTDPNGTPVAGVRVVARLRPVPGFLADASEVVGQEQTVSNGSGAWSLVLTRNADITPSGTYYEVTEYTPYGNRTVPSVWNISVSANATLLASLITPPTGNPPYETATDAVATAVDAHEVDAAAHSGTYVPSYPTLVLTYNGDGTLASVAETAGGTTITTTFTYNGDGSLATSTRLGVVRTYTYSGGQLTAVA